MLICNMEYELVFSSNQILCNTCQVRYWNPSLYLFLFNIINIVSRDDYDSVLFEPSARSKLFNFISYQKLFMRIQKIFQLRVLK